MFSESSVAKSPRIVPGAESAGIGRAHHRADAGDRVLAADGEGEHGAGGDERTRSPKNGLPLCSA